MSRLRAAMVGFEITPRIHPEHGAWGTTPLVQKLDPESSGLRSRCLVLDQGERRVIWFGSDLCGEPVPFTQQLRSEVAEALGVDVERVVWSTSQSHSTGAIPGSAMSGSALTKKVAIDKPFIEMERRRLMDGFIGAARQAIDQLQPVQIWSGRGYCDSIGYNSRLPMPSGGCKFSRSYAEGLQSGKFYDPTIGLVRFDGADGKPIGAIFNFCCHPAVLIRNEHCSPDWVGTARQCIEEALDGAPAMFLQGFCGDVHPRHMFGTPQQAAMLGRRLGQAAVEALPTLIPTRPDPFAYAWKTIELPCQRMPTRDECEQQIAECEAFIAKVTQHDPQATWVCGYNHPDPDLFTAEQRAAGTQLSIDYYRELIRLIDAGQELRQTHSLTLGALRLGDVAAALSPGENFTLTGLRVRSRSPFVHTLICGDTNGLFGYVGTDDEIDRGGAETSASWRLTAMGGYRLPLAKGSAQRVTDELVSLLRDLRK